MFNFVTEVSWASGPRWVLSIVVARPNIESMGAHLGRRSHVVVCSKALPEKRWLYRSFV